MHHKAGKYSYITGDTHLYTQRLLLCYQDMLQSVQERMEKFVSVNLPHHHPAQSGDGQYGCPGTPDSKQHHPGQPGTPTDVRDIVAL